MEKLRRLSKKDYIENGRHIKVNKRIAKSFALHSHDYFEIEIFLSGGGKQRINSVEYEIGRGSVCLLTPADFHEIELYGGTEIWNVVFDETVLGESMAEELFSARELCKRVDEGTLFRLDRAAELLAAECESGGYVEPLLEYLLKLIFPESEGQRELTPIRRALLYIENHFREDPSLDEAARQACLSTVYFGNLFKKETGETYVNYLNRCKVNCAMMLLENGMSVSRAGFDSGFGSLSGFLYTFKKFVGVSPKEYRDTHFVSSR